jgi:hypothetical protein
MPPRDSLLVWWRPPPERCARFPLLAVLLVVCGLWPACPRAEAVGLAQLLGERAGSAVQRAEGASLEDIATHLQRLGPDLQRTALAAAATGDGHWRFLNARGEPFTAGTTDEIARVGAILLPDAGGNAALALYIGEDTIFHHRQALGELPKGSTLNLVLGEESCPIVTRGEGGAERIFARLRTNLLVEMREQAAFREAVWQLARPLSAADVRVLALEPGGPPTLAASPRIDPVSGRALVDTVDPQSLAASLKGVRGQTLLLTGRSDGRLLTVQPASGGERSVALAELAGAAEAADVNLVMLVAKTTPRQPGGRNWLWQKVEVKGLEQALAHARLADFFNALAATNSPLCVTATMAARRTRLAIAPIDGETGSPFDVGGVFSGIVSQITGRVAIAGVDASLRSAARERELSWRIIPGLPADVQAGYLLLVVLGLFALPAARASYRRLWPPESPTEYAGRAGYVAALAVRATIFGALFLPLFAAWRVPGVIARQLADALAGAVRIVRGRRPRAAANP